MESQTWLRSDKWPEKGSQDTFTSVDFFSGCGGLTLGLWEAGRRCGIDINVKLGIDIMPEAKEVFQHNFGDSEFILGDIEEIIDGDLEAPLTESEQRFQKNIGAVDIVVGGPPCQGHSDLNNHSRRDDPRNDLYLRMARSVKILSPKIVLIENVQTVTRAKTNVVPRTRKFLSKLGYVSHDFTVKAAKLGLAQRRVRHFTIAVKDSNIDLKDLMSSIPLVLERPLSWAIGDLGVGKTLFETPSTHQKQNVDRISWLFGEGWTDEEKKSEFNVGTFEKPHAFNLINSRRPKCHQNGHNYPAVYGRMKWNEATPTITTGFGSTGQGRFVHPKEKRTLTPHEAARVQAFPDFFKFDVVRKRQPLHKLIGNAVPPLMVVPMLVKLFNELNPDYTEGEFVL